VAQQTAILERAVSVGARGGWRRNLAEQEGLVIGVAAVVAFMLFWEWVGTSGVINPMFSSSPSRIVKAADRLFFDGGIGAVFAGLLAGNLAAAWSAVAKGSIWKDIWVSSQEVFWGYGLALLVGMPLGLAMGWFRRLSYLLGPFVSVLYATPSVALVALYIIWFGIGMNSKIAIIFMSAVFYPLIYGRTGVTSVNADLLKCARSFGANDFQLLRTVVLPSSIPYLMTGARLGLGRGLVGMVVGELYAATAGVGYLITVAGATFQTDKVFVGVLIVTLAGVAGTAILQRLEERFSGWRPRFDEESSGT
jgi:ABC-type nitrate/sulfonate/bicarbonate transport system permease component